MYRKLLAKSLFIGHALLTDNQLVLIINADGTIEGMVPIAEAGEDIEHMDGLLCPGFINTHCHLELSHMKGVIPEKTGMVGFIFGVMGKRTMDNGQWTMDNADAGMWANGIQAVGDICNTADTVLTKQKSPIYYRNFVEISGFVPAGADLRFNGGMAVVQAFDNHFPKGQSTVTPHAPYSVSKELFAKIAAENPSIISVHNQESQAESDFIGTKTGDLLKLYEALGVDISFFSPKQKSSLQYMLPMLPKDSQKLFVHNCFTTQDDLNVLSNDQRLNTNDYFCLCPNANLYIGNPLPDVKMLVRSGFPICLGTDSLASNHQLSILEEMKTLQSFYPNNTVKTLLQWATLNGAQALKLEDRFGSFEKGKTPGVLQINGIESDGLLKNATIKRVV